MHVITNEVHVDLIGFELSVTSPPDCGCDNDTGAGCSNCGVKTITIDAAEREDGHAPQRLVLRGHPDGLRRMLRDALMYVDTDPS